jgi:hypothetical protein
MGYFGDLKTRMEPGPSDGTATVKFVDLGQADMGYPSPGVFSFAIANGMDLVSVWHMGAYDVFDFAFRPGEGVKDLKQLEGKTVLLGSAAWQSIADPMFAAAGADPKKVKYLEAGWPQWGTVLASGQGDAALSWEGLRADWTGKGLKFEYWLGVDHSALPANSFVARRKDIEDPDRRKPRAYLRGWAMGPVRPRHRARRPRSCSSVPDRGEEPGADSAPIADAARQRVPRQYGQARGLGRSRHGAVEAVLQDAEGYRPAQSRCRPGERHHQ